MAAAFALQLIRYHLLFGARGGEPQKGGDNNNASLAKPLSNPGRRQHASLSGEENVRADRRKELFLLYSDMCTNALPVALFREKKISRNKEGGVWEERPSSVCKIL